MLPLVPTQPTGGQLFSSCQSFPPSKWPSSSWDPSLGRDGGDGASPSSGPRTPRDPAKWPHPPGWGGSTLPLEQGRVLTGGSNLQSTRRGWGLLPSPPLINVLPIWESRLRNPPRPPPHAGHGVLGEQRNPRLPSSSWPHSQHLPPTRSSRSSLHPHPETLSCLLILSISSHGLCPSLGGTEIQLMGNLGDWVPQLSVHMRCPPQDACTPARVPHSLPAVTQTPTVSREGAQPRSHSYTHLRCHRHRSPAFHFIVIRNI